MLATSAFFVCQDPKYALRNMTAGASYYCIVGTVPKRAAVCNGMIPASLTASPLPQTLALSSTFDATE